jgi:hypothetical protein
VHVKELKGFRLEGSQADFTRILTLAFTDCEATKGLEDKGTLK